MMLVWVPTLVVVVGMQVMGENSYHQHRESCGPQFGYPVSFVPFLGVNPGWTTPPRNTEGEADYEPIITELRDTMQDLKLFLGRSERQVVDNFMSKRPRNCKDLLDAGDSGQGVRQIYPFPGRIHDSVSVFCDHTVDGGGWTVFQRRTNTTAREDFNRKWVEYQLGFGHLNSEFWLGLDVLHALTSSSLQELRVDLADYEGATRWAKYGVFYVGPPEDYYRLRVDRYTGDAVDALIGHHNGQQFSTIDEDHDKYSGSCVEKYGGAWWFQLCYNANLNGYQHEGPVETALDSEGIVWLPWRGPKYSLMNVTLMIRPAF